MQRYIFVMILFTFIVCLSNVVSAVGITVNYRDFHNQTSSPYYDMTVKALAKELEKDFKRISHLSIGNRKKLEEDTALLLLPTSNIYSTKLIKKFVAAGEGSDLVLLGSLKLDRKKNLKITVKFLDIDKKKIIGTFSIKGPEKHLHIISDRIVLRTVKIINTRMPEKGAIELSPQTISQIELGNTTNYQAYLTIQEAEKALSKEEYQYAILKYEKVLELDPHYYQAYEILGRINEKLKYNGIAFYYYNQFLARSIKTLGKEKLMNTYFKMAQHLDNAGAFGSSLGYFEASLKYEKSFEDPESLGDKYFYVGIEQFKNAKYKSSIRSFNKALEIYNNLKSHVNQARIHEALGFVYLKTAKLDDARNHYEKAVNIYEQLEDRLRAARVYNMLGLIYSEDKKFNEALTFFGMSSDYWTTVGNRNGIIQVYLNIAQVYEKDDQIKNALYYYQKGLEESKLVGDKTKTALFHYYLTTLVKEKEPYDLTINEEEDIQQLEAFSYLQRLASLFNNIGLYYKALDNQERAFEYFVKAVNINERLGQQVNLEASYNNLGLYFMDKGDYKNSFLYLVKALKVSEKLGNQLNIAKRYHNIGALYYKKKEYNKALLSLKRSLGLREEAGDPIGIASTSYNIALIHHATANKEEGLKNINRAMEIEKAYGSPNYISSRKLYKKILKLADEENIEENSNKE